MSPPALAAGPGWVAAALPCWMGRYIPGAMKVAVAMIVLVLAGAGLAGGTDQMPQ